MRNLDAVFDQLALSQFRRRFALGPVERRLLDRKGLPTILAHARDLVARRLAPAEPAADGRQTPLRGHPVFVAQHATATCCRGCLSKWHGIPKGLPLSPAEQDHVVEVLARWLRSRGGGSEPAPTPEQGVLPLFAPRA